MPKVNGIMETSLYVVDIDRSRIFYQSLFEFPEISREGTRLLALRVAHSQVLLLFSVGRSTSPTDTAGGRIPSHNGWGDLHVAFAINPSAVEPWRTYLDQLNIQIESEVDCPDGGHSIYFRDPDNHLIELITEGCWPSS